ncbi:hypothetical protein B0H21DRAFT_752628 [Amylocystis lapponica]|nr:hypothetical protein B0H21DRAFT_752628 [Amylocystis lapponica]
MSAKARGKRRAAEPEEVDVEAQDDTEAARPNKRARTQRAPKAKATWTRARRAPPASEPVIQATPAPRSPPISGAGPMQAVTKEAKRKHLDLQLAAVLAAMESQSAAVLAALNSQCAAARQAPTRPDSATGPTRAAPSLPGHARLLELSEGHSSGCSGSDPRSLALVVVCAVGHILEHRVEEDAVLESAEGEKPAVKASRKRKMEVVEGVPKAKRMRVSTRERKPSTLALTAAAENERAAILGK